MVGPCGMCDTVRAFGVPRCSCNKQMSDSPAFCAELTRSGNTSPPRFRRNAVGSRSRNSLANVDRREEGFLDVVTRTRGSTMPDNSAYSSSMSIASATLRSGRDSSYCRSLPRCLSPAISWSSGLPVASACFSLARFSLISASRSFPQAPQLLGNPLPMTAQLTQARASAKSIPIYGIVLPHECPLTANSGVTISF